MILVQILCNEQFFVTVYFKLCHGLAGVPGWATRCHCLFVCAHGLLFVVGAMCPPIYCLTPPSLLSHYCFSYFTWVLLVCLPLYSPGVCNPVLRRYLCFMSDGDVVCVVCLPACFSPSGWLLFFLFLFYK